MPDNAIVEQPELHDRTRVFRDRAAAGAVLSTLLSAYRDGNACVLAIPAGGVPVGAAVASALRLELHIAVVSKITLPWDTESGCGAIAFDGSVELNQRLLPYLRLTEQELADAVEKTRHKVITRVRRFSASNLDRRIFDGDVIVVDDGLASGFTMEVACRALRRAGAARLIVAVPTGHLDAVRRVSAEADRVVCANVREGRTFAVADAYEHWYDVSEEEAELLLRAFKDGR